MLASHDIDTREGEVEGLERLRLQLTQQNDADGLEKIVADDMIYVHEDGRFYTGTDYIRQIRSRGLLYKEDVDLAEEERRLVGDTFFSLGTMTGHAMLEGERQVLNLRYLAVWIRLNGDWRLQLVHKTHIQHHAHNLGNAWR